MSSKPTYVSSTGTLTAQPWTTRITTSLSSYGTLFYLYWETLFAPMVNPALFANPALRTDSGRPSSGPRSSPGGGGGSGGGFPRGGGGSGGGFMSMGDLRGGGTVDGCRATCG